MIFKEARYDLTAGRELGQQSIIELAPVVEN
jgi:hypothetical protein